MQLLSNIIEIQFFLQIFNSLNFAISCINPPGWTIFQIKPIFKKNVHFQILSSRDRYRILARRVFCGKKNRYKKGGAPPRSLNLLYFIFSTKLTYLFVKCKYIISLCLCLTVCGLIFLSICHSVCLSRKEATFLIYLPVHLCVCLEILGNLNDLFTSTGLSSFLLTISTTSISCCFAF